MVEDSGQSKSHPVFPEMDKCHEVLASALKLTAGNAETFNALEQIQHSLEFVMRGLQQSDSMLLPPPFLENIRIHAKGARGELQGFLNDKDSKHLVEATSRLNGILPSAFGLPVPYSQSVAEQIGDDIVHHRKMLDQQTVQLSERIKSLTADLQKLQDSSGALSKEIGQQKARLDTAISDFQKQFSEGQAARLSEFSAAERTRQNAHTDLLKEIASSNKSASDGRQQMFDKWIDESSKKAAELMTTNDAEAKSQIAQITQLRAEAEKIVGLIGEHGMVHGYQTQANSARISFRVWSGTAVVALLCWIVFGLAAFRLTYDQDLAWTTVVRQFLVSTPFLLLATFAGYQAFVQQRTTSRFRRRELEIASLDPFLASLSREESNTVKKEMVARFFGHSETDDTPAPPDFAATAFGIIDRLTANSKKH
jgi:hypothetical protein